MNKLTFDPDAMKTRLIESIEKDGRSQSAIVKSAGLGHGYLTNILVRDQMPSIDKLDTLCTELGIALPWLLYGINLPPDYQRVFELMRRNPDKFYQALSLLE